MNKKKTYLIIIFLILATCTVFSRILCNEFINFDDNLYITENSHIQSGFNLENIKWAFTSIVVSNWHPLTLLSHMLDWHLFGNYAGGHHLVSLLLHIGTAILLFLFLHKTTGNLWLAAFAAAFFALHPLRVESVAWASERKDVLSMFFGMASIYAYAFYAEKARISRYSLCLLLFILSLMSKPMLVTLPFVLLLLDYWPLNRWQKTLEALTEKRFYAAGKLISEKIPFFILTIAISILTFWVQNKSGAMAQVDSIPFDMRLSNAIFSYLVYLGKILLPTNMSIFYPYEFTIPLIKILISTIVLTATTLFVFYYIKTIPFLFVGWFWFLGTLVPVIGLVQVGSQAMADRYTYLPSIGISIILAWGFPRLSQTVKINKIILIFTAITVLFTLSFLTWIHCGYWKNSITIFNHALRVSKDNYLAYNNFGVALSAEGMIKEAIENYDKAIRVKPNHAEAYNNRGNAYIKIGLYQPAIEDYKMAILIKPDYAEAYNNYGSAYLLQGNTDLGCPLAQKACVMGICKALEKAKGNGFCR